MLLSVAGIAGAMRVNLTLTYVSTLGFAILALIYGLVVYVPGIVVSLSILLIQMLLIWEMMEGVVTKEDDALLSEQGKAVIKAVESFQSDAA
ncbi:MAG: hypothetical protein SGARI_008266 [Bacillariaceae sp.]